MYDLRLDRKLTKSMFAKWDKETKDWVVNAIASLVVVDQVVESHEMVALQEAIELLDSRNEIENLMNMIKQKKMFKIDNLNTSMSQAGEIYFYLAAIACIDGKMKKVEADLLKELGQKLNLPVDFQKAVMKWGINQMNHNQRWSQENKGRGNCSQRQANLCWMRFHGKDRGYRHLRCSRIADGSSAISASCASVVRIIVVR